MNKRYLLLLVCVICAACSKNIDPNGQWILNEELTLKEPENAGIKDGKMTFELGKDVFSNLSIVNNSYSFSIKSMDVVNNCIITKVNELNGVTCITNGNKTASEIFIEGEILKLKQTGAMSLVYARGGPSVATAPSLPASEVSPSKVSQSSVSQDVPFVGGRYFNFDGGNGTQKSITINGSGETKIENLGTTGSSVAYLGPFTNPIHLKGEGELLIKNNKVYQLKNGKVEKGCKDVNEECVSDFYPMDEQRAPLNLALALADKNAITCRYNESEGVCVEQDGEDSTPEEFARKKGYSKILDRTTFDEAMGVTYLKLTVKSIAEPSKSGVETIAGNSVVAKDTGSIKLCDMSPTNFNKIPDFMYLQVNDACTKKMSGIYQTIYSERTKGTSLSKVKEILLASTGNDGDQQIYENAVNLKYRVSAAIYKEQSSTAEQAQKLGACVCMNNYNKTETWR